MWETPSGGGGAERHRGGESARRRRRRVAAAAREIHLGDPRRFTDFVGSRMGNAFFGFEDHAEFVRSENDLPLGRKLDDQRIRYDYAIFMI